MDMTVAGLGYPKGRTRKQLKAKKDRAEARVKKVVRAACVTRDWYCRVVDGVLHKLVEDIRDQCEPGFWIACNGPSEWAHLHTRRRSQTRGEAPEQRHTTAGSLMLCKFCHDAYDGRTKPRLLIRCLTRKGADGPLKFTRAKS